MDPTLLTTLWLLICAGLVALMQAGFLCLETGFTRSKNNINVAVKNVADFGVSSLFFWLVGYAVMFGQGTDIAFSFETNSTELTFFVFQLMFCGTTVTIISGGAAERLSFRGYMLVSIIVAAIIYPVYGHWVWHGLLEGNLTGWLGRLGFVDFAGSSVVHSIGGWSCLALLLHLGPRHGRFDAETGQTNKIIGANLPFAALGVVILWVGWFGFNGGSLLAFNDQVPRVFASTALSGMSGMLATMIVSLWFKGKITAESFLNGPLAGLVSVTASANAVSAIDAIIIGAVGGLVAYGIEQLLLRYQIDDAVGAVPVHLGAGVWGTIAAGLFGSPTLLGTGLSPINQLLIQLLGVALAFVWAFGVTYLTFYFLNRLFTLRVPLDAELVGLNVYEHDARTDILDMFLIMDQQAKTGDLSLRIPEEPFTEVGQVAGRYNNVMEQLEETMARVSSIVKTAQDGIITFAPQTFKIQSANPAAASILGTNEAYLLNHNISSFLKEPLNEYLPPNDNSQIYHEFIGIRANGLYFPIEIAISQIVIGSKVYYSALFRDITERKQLIHKISEARDAALQAVRLKNQFLAMVSHELRTPIMSISGSAEVIEAGILGDVTDAQKQFLSQIVDSSFHLENLVNDLIEQSHLQSGNVSLSMGMIEIRPFVERVTFAPKQRASAKQLELVISIADTMPSKIRNDSTRLNQIITNLLANSIKFTDTGKIKLELHDISSTHWCLQVKDTGRGIPKAKQQEIFEPFRQVEDVATRESGGFGLGLAVVKQLVDLLGASIELHSVVNEGTTISITFPYHNEHTNNSHI